MMRTKLALVLLTLGLVGCLGTNRSVGYPRRGRSEQTTAAVITSSAVIAPVMSAPADAKKPPIGATEEDQELLDEIPWEEIRYRPVR